MDKRAARKQEDARTSEIEDLAGNLVAFLEELETALSEACMPPAFEERLAQLQRSAKRLI